MRKRKTEKKSLVLTEPEMEAALQLIQLSSGDDYSDNNSVNKVLNEEDSEVISSALNLKKRNLEVEFEDDYHSLRSKKKKFRLIIDLYFNTKPLINSRPSDYKVRG